MLKLDTGLSRLVRLRENSRRAFRRLYRLEETREDSLWILTDNEPLLHLNEFEFRWNTRKADDGERISRAIKAADGKRLKYRESVDNPPYLVEWPAIQASAPFEG